MYLLSIYVHEVQKNGKEKKIAAKAKVYVAYFNSNIEF